MGKYHQPAASGSWLLSPTGRGTLELVFRGTRVGLGLGEHPEAVSLAVWPVSGHSLLLGIGLLTALAHVSSRRGALCVSSLQAHWLRLLPSAARLCLLQGDLSGGLCADLPGRSKHCSVSPAVRPAPHPSPAALMF